LKNFAIISQIGKRSFTRKNDVINAAFTLSGFDDQERNLTFVKTAFQILKLNFLVAVYPLHKQNIARA